eukprot:3696537-Rhodomonas_salina.1
MAPCARCPLTTSCHPYHHDVFAYLFLSHSALMSLTSGARSNLDVTAAKKSTGATARQVAEQGGHAELAQLLQQAELAAARGESGL